jgi:DNA-binding XRE family transcriptional regulator
MSEKSSDAVEWAYRRYIKGNPEREASFAEAGRQADLAQQIYDIRHKLHMTREDLAELSGLTPEAIEDLEESDYDGDWDAAIDRINSAFRQWFQNVILPASRMREDEYSIKVLSA